METPQYNSPQYWVNRFETFCLKYESGGLQGYLLPQSLYEEFINQVALCNESDSDFITRMEKMNEMGFKNLQVFISIGPEWKDGDHTNFWSEEIHLKSDDNFTVDQIIALANWFHSADEFEITNNGLILGYAN